MPGQAMHTGDGSGAAGLSGTAEPDHAAWLGDHYEHAGPMPNHRSHGATGGMGDL